MPEIFINYRSGDGEKTAALIEEVLTRRFGAGATFRASSTIRPGTEYPRALLNGVRRSSVLLAVIGADWLNAPSRDTPGQRALEDRHDWVRKEILEAYRCAVPVVPVLEGRDTPRLDAARLPAPLARLADVQSVRLDVRQKESDLRRLGDVLAELVPSLAEADSERSTAAESGGHDAVRNFQSGSGGMSVQARDISGQVSHTSVRHPTGPVNTGPGSQHTHYRTHHDNSTHHNGGRHFHGGQHVDGDGATFVAGDVHDGVRHHFGRSREREDER